MENYKPFIGKNVIETLTLGMYENAYFIYREYVQNAADQIDVAVEKGVLANKNEGQIYINVDKENKSISIEDNATGIKSSQVLSFLGDVANSQKDRTKRKGFRGIGRLGGLGYCDTLIFETSYQGETTKSIITLDAKQLRKIIADRTIRMDASTVISVITQLKETPEDIDKHYFKVKLLNVTNEDLLDEKEVKDYLSMVAPIPFRKEFEFAKEIHDYFERNGLPIEEYDVQLSLNNERLFKLYKVNLHSQRGSKSVKVLDIEFFKIYGIDKDLIAIAWYGVTDLLNNIIRKEDIERGFRLRRDNIQIGNEDTLNRFFKENRFNKHFIGEIYLIGDNFIPNARRDYFNHNSTIETLEKQLKERFADLYKLSHISSNIHNRIKEIEKYNSQKEWFENHKFGSQYEENKARRNIEILQTDAIEAQDNIEKIMEKATSNYMIRSAAQSIYKFKIEDVDFSIYDDLEPKVQEYLEPALSILDKKSRKIVLEIFKIIEDTLTNPKEVVKLKKKIAERYN